MNNPYFTQAANIEVLDVGMCSHSNIKATDATGGYKAVTFRELMAMAANPVNADGSIKLVKPPANAKDQSVLAHHKATATKYAGWITPSTLMSRDIDKQRAQGQFFGCGLDFDDVPVYFDWLDGVERVLGKLVYIAYSSSRCSQDNQKMRVMIPFNRPISGTEFEAVTKLMFDDLEAAGLAPDAAMKEPNRVFFLPYHGELYRWTVSTGNEFFGHGRKNANVDAFDPMALAIDESMLMDPLGDYAARMSDESVGQKEIDRQMAKAVAAERRRLNKKPHNADLAKPIDWFNAHTTIADLLLRHGYETREHRLGQQFRHPASESGSFSGVVFANDGVERYFTLSTTDRLHDPEQRAHSAFSVYTVLDHNGDSNSAVKAAAAMMKQGQNVISPQVTIEVTEEDEAMADEILEADRVGSGEVSGMCIKPFRGPMEDLTEAIIASSFKSQPNLAVAAAITGMAAGIPHQYCLHGGGRIGLYSMVLSPTSSGKNHIEESAKKIAMDCGSSIISGDHSSGQGVEDHILRVVGKPHFMHMPEAAHVMKCYSSDSRTPPHLMALFSKLLTLSSGSGHYTSRLLANKESATMPMPSFSFLAASTPEKMGAVITPENIAEGLVNRMLFFIGDSKPKSHYDHDHELKYTDTVK
mgnify:FL=1